MILVVLGYGLPNPIWGNLAAAGTIDACASSLVG
jgi:hypothetical protein